MSTISFVAIAIISVFASDVPIAPRAPQQKKARRSCGRKHTFAPAFIIKLLIRTRRGVFRDV